jgi:flagellar biosynthesis GTPase FlhF
MICRHRSEKKIKNCTVFVIIGTEKAAQSEFVGREIAEFKQTGRTILPIDFNGSVGSARWYEEIPGLATENEKAAKLKTGNPSENVINFVEKSFNYTRRNQYMFRMFWGALSLFLILMALGVGAFIFARTQITAANLATQKANDATDLANQKEAEATQKKKEAEDANRAADEAKKQAKEAGDLAEKQKLLADAATKKAEEKTKIADAATQRAEEQTLKADAATKKADEQTQRAEKAQKLVEKGRSTIAQNYYSIAQTSYLTDRNKTASTTAQIFTELKQFPLEDGECILKTRRVPNQNLFLSFSYSTCDKTSPRRFVKMRLWDSETGLPKWNNPIIVGINEESGIDFYVGSVIFDESGKSFITVLPERDKPANGSGWEREIRMWETESGNETIFFPLQYANSFKFQELGYNTAPEKLFRFGNSNSRMFAAKCLAKADKLMWDDKEHLRAMFDEGFSFAISTSGKIELITVAGTRTEAIPPLISGDLQFAMGGKLIVVTNLNSIEVFETKTALPVVKKSMSPPVVFSEVRSNQNAAIIVDSAGKIKLWNFGSSSKTQPFWTKEMGEALSGMRVINDTQTQMLSQEEYLEIRRRYLETLKQKARDKGDAEAQLILDNWSPSN